MLPPLKNIFWQDSAEDSSRPLNICIWGMLESQIHVKCLEDLIEKVIKYQNNKNILHFPEMQQYVISFGGYTFWKWDKNFQVKNHYRFLNPEPSSLEWTELDLRKALSQLSSSPFKKDQSPWEAIVIRNYRLGPNSIGSVIILRCHHVLGDGYSFLKMFLEQVCQGEHKPVIVPQLVHKEPSLGMILSFPLRCIYDLTQFTSNLPYDRNAWKIPFGQLKREYYTLWSPDLNVGDIKGIKNSLNVSFQAVIISAIGAGLQKLFPSGGKPIPGEITAFVPLPLPNRPEKRGFEYHASGVFVKIPLNETDPARRLVRSSNSLKKAAKMVSMSQLKIASLAGRIPFLSSMSDCVKTSGETVQSLSIFPGIDGNLFIQGHRILSAGFSINPSSRGNSGVAISSLSSFGHVKIVVTIDQGLIPLERISGFEEGVRDEIQALMLMADKNKDTVVKIN
ncbi:unnamed protein product [Allacma fusca]|uniref:diacylglycerol O-acyltransferase n=1 Tax=Allacma fusca TaxID=39272 RepID=A0A8J2PAQ7_9HEXA|nr:unnamed protein product [Allacma fusca]